MVLSGLNPLMPVKLHQEMLVLWSARDAIVKDWEKTPKRDDCDSVFCNIIYMYIWWVFVVLKVTLFTVFLPMLQMFCSTYIMLCIYRIHESYNTWSTCRCEKENWRELLATLPPRLLCSKYIDGADVHTRKYFPQQVTHQWAVDSKIPGIQKHLETIPVFQTSFKKIQELLKMSIFDYFSK